MCLSLKEGAGVGGKSGDTRGAMFVLDLALRNVGKCIFCF